MPKRAPGAFLDAPSPQTSISSLSRVVKRALEAAAEHIAIYAAGCQSGYAATALYDDLSRLSDAELARRGLTRADIARRVLQQLDPE
jgi:hypothetical protein